MVGADWEILTLGRNTEGALHWVSGSSVETNKEKTRARQIRPYLLFLVGVNSPSYLCVKRWMQTSNDRFALS